MLLGWLRTGAHKFYALGDKHESISTLEEVEEAWRAVKPMDRDDGYMLVSQVHAIENLQPEDMKRIKKEWRDAKKGAGSAARVTPGLMWVHIHSRCSGSWILRITAVRCGRFFRRIAYLKFAPLLV